MTPDIYVLKARRLPVLLVVLPVSLALFAFFPEANWKILLPICTFFGLFGLTAQLGRDQGKSHEPYLFAGWGGKPTTALLRHTTGFFDQSTLSFLHQWLGNATGVSAPTAAAEAEHGSEADKVYDGYVRYLRDATRDRQQYPLIFAENVSYGFRRNAWGLRRFGIAFAGVGTIGIAAAIVLGDATARPVAVGATAITGLLLVFWWRWVTREWVRIAAQAYAERLVEAALAMARAAPGPQEHRGQRGVVDQR